MRKIWAVICGLLVSCQVSAADSTWSDTNTNLTRNWSDTNNWTNGIPGPGDTAILSDTQNINLRIIDIDPQAPAEVSAITLTDTNSGIDQPYGIDNKKTEGFTINGLGINGKTGVVITNSAPLIFKNSATFITTNQSVIGNSLLVSNATISFSDSSSLGTAALNNYQGGTVTFNDNATAGLESFITNYAGAILNFNGNSSAGKKFIDSSGSLTFSDTATAGESTINIEANSSPFFNAGTTAGTATINNEGTGTLTFTGAGATASGATINNQSTGKILFATNAKAGTAKLNNLVAGSQMEFRTGTNAEMATINNAGTLEFTTDTSSAGSAMITNNSRGGLNFNEGSTADKATITNQGDMRFNIPTFTGNKPTAGESKITNLSLGTLSFFKDTTAGTSTITNENALSFTANSDAENATLIQRSAGVTTLASRTEPLKLGSLTGEGIINVDNNDATLSVGHLNRDETFAGHFQDAAGSVLNVAKEGTGTMILTGQMHTFSGDLDVNAGTLQWEGLQSANLGTGNINIASGATFSGVNSLIKTAINNGTISPGTPTMPFGNLAFSSFSGAGTINIAVDPSNNSSLSGSVGGNLTGATLNLDIKTGNYAECTSYPIVNAAGLNTEFAAITGLENLPRFTASVDYTTTPDTATLNLKMVPIIDILKTVGNTGNGDQTTLAGALDGTNTNADFNALIGQLNMFSTEQILQALNQLGTDQFNLNPLSDFFSAEMISEIFADGFESGDNSVWGSAAPYRASFNSVSARHALTKNRNLHAARFTKAADFFDNALALKDALGAHNRNHVRETISNHAGTGYSWIQGFGSHTDVKQTFDDIGFRANTAGVMLGTDYQINDNFRAGMGGGYTQTKLKASCNLSESKINSPFFAAWGHYEYGAYDVDLGLTYRHNNNKGKKFITVFNRVADNKHKGFNLMPHLKAARVVNLAKDVIMKPYLGVDYFYSHEDGFTQTGANGLNLKVKKRDSSIIQGKIGTYLDRETKWDCGIMHHGLGVSYKIRKTVGKSETEATFVGGTTPFVSSRKTPTNHRFGADGHLSFIWDSGAHIKATYHGDFGRKQSAHSGTVSIGKSW